MASSGIRINKLVNLNIKDVNFENKSCYNVYPHKFRRTLATCAIDKGMPIELVQHLLEHTKIDTTLHHAMVNQNNVKISHRKYIC